MDYGGTELLWNTETTNNPARQKNAKTPWSLRRAGKQHRSHLRAWQKLFQYWFTAEKTG